MAQGAFLPFSPSKINQYISKPSSLRKNIKFKKNSAKKQAIINYTI